MSWKQYFISRGKLFDRWPISVHLQIRFVSIQFLRLNEKAMCIRAVCIHYLQVFTIKTYTETNYLLSSVPLIHAVVFVRYQALHFLYQVEMRQRDQVSGREYEREGGRDAYCEFSIWFYKDDLITQFNSATRSPELIWSWRTVTTQVLKPIKWHTDTFDCFDVG